ncbi:MAG: hypothetical protein JWR54_3162 [Mucilaginibacter sp.]|nr:hypothetical protein [Mucilaginibacter sp.]
MEQLQANANKVATKWALIYVLTAIVITYIIQFSNLDPNSSVKYLSYIPFIAFLLLAQKEYKDQLGGYIKFGDAFSAGFRFALYSGILLAVFIYVYLTFLSPEVLSKAMDSQRDKMTEQGLSSEQIDKGMEIGKKYGAIFGAVGGAIAYAILGVILGLIGAAIFKKERSAFDPEPTITDTTV